VGHNLAALPGLSEFPGGPHTMSPERLLKHFERIADAPDAVPRLRRFILDLAVRGKLVEQDPKDEPAGELLKRIMDERERSCRGRGRSKSSAAIGNRDIPFSVPESWQWTLLGSLCHLENGDRSKNYPSRDQLVEKGIPFINAGHLQSGRVCMSSMNFITTERYDILNGGKVKNGDILFCLRGSLGKAAIVEGVHCGAIASSLVIVRLMNGVCPTYCLNYFSSALASQMVKLFDNGTAQPNLSAADLAKFLVPLPSLAEQKRIVAKVDELMGLCDELEAAQAKRESRRDRLVGATLHGLHNGESKAETGMSFPETARFYFNHLPRLTTRPQHIHQLRQTILNLAVRGRLVPQDPNDEPVEAVKVAELDDAKKPFQTPSSWRWTTIRNLGTLRGGGTPSKARSELWDGSIPWVTPKDMKRDHMDGAQMCITQKALEESAAKLIAQGSILFVVRGMILAHSFPVALTTVAVTVNQDMKALTLRIPGMGEFVLRALKGLKPCVLAKVQRSSHGTCRLESSDYETMPFPLPPLAEQNRIVAKVDELMALCDELETHLTEATTTRRQLLEATLAEALQEGN
jgi:type I restriction enzyme S subunit